MTPRRAGRGIHENCDHDRHRAGQAGLSVSHCLTESSVDHVLLERGAVANSWKRERWDSLRLLTPNWQSRLPGFGYTGDDPDGFMTMNQVTGFLDTYARRIDAPVLTDTAVTAVSPTRDGYVVATSQGPWTCRTVVIATGACNVPVRPAMADAVPSGVVSITPADYRHPDQLADGGVLIVGAAASGVQLSDEIQASGRAVTLAVGGHVRVPRVYRGMDIMWWLDAAGILDEGSDAVDDVERVRGLPSFQLVGSPSRTTLDLNRLQRAGVRIVGRLGAIRDGVAQFSGSLRNQCTLADLKLDRLLDTVDGWATERGVADEIKPPHRFEPTQVPDAPPLSLDLTTGEIETVIWATGYRPDLSWLGLPVLDHKGRVRHDGGVTEAPGVYITGMPFLRSRKSTLLDGAGDDARAITAHLRTYLASPACAFG